jgi:hypothetical protein
MALSDWADTMAGNGNNCYKYNYGQSMLISNCWAGSWCVCLLYYGDNCDSDYTTIQYSGHDGGDQWEWNCNFNAQSIHSLRCYSYQ